MFQSCQIIIRELCFLLKLYYCIHNSILICKRVVVAAYLVVWECVVEQWLGVRRTTQHRSLPCYRRFGTIAWSHIEGSSSPWTVWSHIQGSCSPWTVWSHIQGSCSPWIVWSHVQGSCSPWIIWSHIQGSCIPWTLWLLLIFRDKPSVPPSMVKLHCLILENRTNSLSSNFSNKLLMCAA